MELRHARESPLKKSQIIESWYDYAAVHNVAAI